MSVRPVELINNVAFYARRAKNANGTGVDGDDVWVSSSSSSSAGKKSRRERAKGVDEAKYQNPSRAFNCRILYGLYLPTVILTVIWYSITHSLFLSRLKTFLLYKSFPL